MVRNIRLLKKLSFRKYSEIHMKYTIYYLVFNIFKYKKRVKN